MKSWQDHQKGEPVGVWGVVQVAHTARLYDESFRQFYLRQSKGKGSKRAVAAVAHEMLRIVWFMLKRNEPYRGERLGLSGRKLRGLECIALDGLRVRC